MVVVLIGRVEAGAQNRVGAAGAIQKPSQRDEHRWAAAGPDPG
jgi:hypothetical protein